MNTSNKILIIGCVGCGKSTYAKKLSKKLCIPVYGIDEIVHDDVLGIRRSLDEQKKIIEEVDSNNKWIIEGSLREELYFLLDMADLIAAFVDNKEMYKNTNLWVSIDSGVFINIKDDNYNYFIQYLYERYPY